MSFTKTASIKFLNTLTDAVDITVVDFDTEVRAARYGQNEFARLIERIRQKKASGDTALYDAIGDLSRRRRRPGRPEDHAALHRRRRHAQLDPVARAARSAQGVGCHRLRRSAMLEHQSQSAKHRAAHDRCSRWPRPPAGRRFSRRRSRSSTRSTRKCSPRSARSTRSGYLSTNDKADGAWRKVEVKVVRKDGRDLRIRARKGYFALFRK